MHNTSSSMRRIAHGKNLILVLVLFTLTAGCTHVDEWLRGGRDTPRQELGPDAGGITPYIGEMSLLVAGDPATQAEVYADAAAAARLTPDTGSRLRFALVLAAPGHPGSDPGLAQDILRELLAAPELLTPIERSLATIHLGQVEERLTLDAEARRLRLASTRATNSEDEAIARRIASVESENAQLRQSLAEAQEKLDAITSIERSIREQTDNGQQ